MAEQGAERDLSPAFMIDLAHKDLGIALDVANQLHVPMPLGAASVKFTTRLAPPGAREDWTAILEQVRASAGLKNHTDTKGLRNDDVHPERYHPTFRRFCHAGRGPARSDAPDVCCGRRRCR
jgi:hypothetical protein